MVLRRCTRVQLRSSAGEPSGRVAGPRRRENPLVSERQPQLGSKQATTRPTGSPSGPTGSPSGPRRHRELDSEQAYLDFAQECLITSRDRVHRITDEYKPTAGGTSQARHERESIVDGVVSRLSKLDLGDRSLVFGRIDEAGTGERFYIGRLGIWDANHDTVVVDWRAPVAEPFYRATGRAPMGLERRRHFSARGSVLLGIEDEVFGDLVYDLRDQATSERVTGEGALIAAIEAARTGRLGDIIGTIQSEQDEIIRAPMPGVLLVQGGPGTGKTVVALHRAAYLLYTHRFPLEGQGVLVIGPNRLFLAYIEQVLPSLGEAGVEVAVLADLLSPRVRVNGFDDEEVAFVKGDLRMTKVLARAVQDRRRRLREDFNIGFGLQRLRLSVDGSSRIVDAARRRFGGGNSGRKFVEDRVFEALATSARKGADPAQVRERLRHETSIRKLLDWIWPVLSPAHLLHDLFGSAALLRSAAKDSFGDEIMSLHRPRSAHADNTTWTFSDVALLDEARALLGKRPGKHDTDVVRTYGHICVDEAQDLSPMELRMIRRRSLNGSMTVVGDIAQGTSAWAAQGWGQVLNLLRSKHPVRRRELTISYRLPGPAMKLANRVLPHAAPGLRPPRPVREDGDSPRLVQVSDIAGPELIDCVRAELDAVGHGNVAVIIAGSDEARLCASFLCHRLDFGVANRHGLDRQVSVVPVKLVKGLEVDSAIVVEPGRILGEEREGVRSLYVALTRATKRITVVHCDPLPELLE